MKTVWGWILPPPPQKICMEKGTVTLEKAEQWSFPLSSVFDTGLWNKKRFAKRLYRWITQEPVFLMITTSNGIKKMLMESPEEALLYMTYYYPNVQWT